MTHTSLVIGSTGLIGKKLLIELSAKEGNIIAVSRRPIKNLPSNIKNLEIDFDDFLENESLPFCDHIYICLGTTIKKAGNKSAFRRVDFEYVHVAAQLARAQRAISFVWISSVGANAKSSNFYLRVKGELENAIINMSGLDNACAVRPSLLLGKREEMRPTEKLATMLTPLLSPLMLGGFSKYKPVQVADVAAQMIRLQVF
jgi:uncharacterized protein YbjT (DUF2867 family)